MEPLLFDVRSLLKDSIFIKEIDEPQIEDQFHFHNTYEIALIISGEGKRITGDSIESFEDGDLIFLGPHMAHVASFQKRENNNNIRALVVYFNPNWFNDEYWSSPSLANLKRTLAHAQRGLVLNKEIKQVVTKKILEFPQLTGFKRTLHLLDILEIISAPPQKYTFLASEGYANSYDQKDLKRMDKVYEHVLANFTEKIKLEEIAAIANMTPTAFCKYFKSKSDKTFSNFLNEMRIGYACKLLCNEDLSISEVCYRSGFNNLANFNRTFKHITAMNPSAYKEKIK